ncbi:hypothetical protein V8C26DRAFT_339099 [Trichoderma gracile]
MPANAAVSAAEVMLWKLVLRALYFAHVAISEALSTWIHTDKRRHRNPSSRWNHRVIRPLCSPAPGARDRRHKRLAVLFRRRFALACPASPMRMPDTDMDGDRGVAKAEPIIQQATTERRSEYGASTAGFARHR